MFSKEWFDAIWDFLHKVIDRTGTKFALAASSIGGILYMVYKGGIPGQLGIAGTAVVMGAIVAINVGYFIWRRAQEKDATVTNGSEAPPAS